MRPFLHHRRAALDTALEQGNDVLRMFREFDLDMGSALERFLGTAIGVFETFDRATENELRSLDAQFVAARHGIDPRTGETVTTRRRALLRSVALHVLLASGEVLREHLRRIDAQFDDARRTLQAIVLNAFALGVLDPATPPGDAAARDAAWTAISRHPDLRAAARQLASQLHPSDLTVLLADVFATFVPLAEPDLASHGALT